MTAYQTALLAALDFVFMALKIIIPFIVLAWFADVLTDRQR